MPRDQQCQRCPSPVCIPCSVCCAAGAPLWSVRMWFGHNPLLASPPPAAGNTVCAVIYNLFCTVVDTATGRVLAMRSLPPAERDAPPAAPPPEKAAAASEPRQADTPSEPVKEGAGPDDDRYPALCATAVAGRLAVSMPRGVQLWRLPGYETLEFDSPTCS